MYYPWVLAVLVYLSLPTLSCSSVTLEAGKNTTEWSILNIFWSNTVKLMDSLIRIFSVMGDSDIADYFSDPKPEDAYFDIKRLASKYGYDLEEHEVQTEDGYILTVHKIPSKNNTAKNNVDVFLMHGIMDTSESWVLQGPGKALAYILADEGYDVWLGNARGNKYSASHISLNTTQSDYWKFTWEEIGVYDLPAMIDYILQKKQKKNLYYVGHSQGTTSFYVMTALKPAYNFKIKMMFSLSPVAYMGNVKSPLVRMFSPGHELLASWLSQYNIHSSSLNYFKKLYAVLCIIVPRCQNTIFLLVGNSHKFMNDSFLKVVFSHIPSGSSTLQFAHYGQLVQSGRFCRYDFGEETNVQTYKNKLPPDYAIEKITAPVVLYYSDNDWLAEPMDVELLISKLPNVAGICPIKGYNHLDFMYATNSKDVIYSDIMERIIMNSSS